MSFDLTGKVALVTGGGRDIGQAVSMELARNGASVAVNYCHSRAQAEDTVRGIHQLGQKAVAISADVTARGTLTSSFKGRSILERDESTSWSTTRAASCAGRTSMS